MPAWQPCPLEPRSRGGAEPRRLPGVRTDLPCRRPALHAMAVSRCLVMDVSAWPNTPIADWLGRGGTPRDSGNQGRPARGRVMSLLLTALDDWAEVPEGPHGPPLTLRRWRFDGRCGPRNGPPGSPHFTRSTGR